MLPGIKCCLAGLLLIVATACAWLPSARQVEDKGSQEFPGWLIQQDGRVLDHQEADRYLTGVLSALQDPAPMRLHLKVEQEISGLPLVTGNRVRLLIDGPQTYAAMFAAIRKARHHIHLNAYIFSDEGIGTKLASLLKEKSAEGVKVRVIHDAIGGLDTPNEFFDDMEAEGVEMARFNPVNPVEDLRVWRLNHREHAKLLIVDGKSAFTGGINISSVYAQRSGPLSSFPSAEEIVSSRAWRDTHLQLNGPIVPYLQSRFLETWATLTGQSIPYSEEYIQAIASQGNVVVRVLDSPADSGKPEVYSLYLSAITQAKKRLWITQSYFSPNSALLTALEAAASRGVDVRILLPGVSDQGLVYHASRSKYGRLLKAGVRLWELEDRILHAKTAVMDGLWSTVGSANLDMRSFIHNNELNVSLLSEDFASQLESQFEKDLDNATEVTPQRWQSRPYGDRFKELGAQLLDYWL